jgi:hypothetical protein
VKGLTAAWLTYIGVATYQWEKNHRGVLPPPGIYLGSSIVFAGLGIVGTAAPGFASTFAWALIVAAGVSGAFDGIKDTPTPAQVADAKALATQNKDTGTGKNAPGNVGKPKTLKQLLNSASTGAGKSGKRLGGKVQPPEIAPAG